MTARARHGVGARIGRVTIAALTLATFTGVVASPATADSPHPDELPAGSLYHVVDQIGARTLWERGITGEGVNVAVIDTGVAPVDALSGADKVVAMADLSPEAHVPEATYLDTYGHGTHMAGIVAGRSSGLRVDRARDSPEEFAGVAPDAGIVSVKVGDNTGAADVSQVIAGIDWVIEHADELDIRVINLSYSTDSLQTYLSDPLSHAVERAWHAGIVVVVAAGNDGLGELRVGVPANNPYVIAVGGVKAEDDGSFSIPDWATNGNGIRNPDVGAPGAHIDSLRSPGSRIDVEHPEGRVDDELFRGSGSSQAAAVTSGAVALLLDARPWLTPDEVKAALVRSADDSGLPRHSEVFAGSGVIRVDRAVSTSVRRSQQHHLRSIGDGSLDASRGSYRLEIGGQPLTGEVTVLGDEWNGIEIDADVKVAGISLSLKLNLLSRSSSSAADDDRLWSGGEWDGNHWTNGTWRGNRWTGSTWTGNHWTGNRWTGVDWSGNHWTGEAWSGSSWTGNHWTGNHWTGNHWTGNHWTGNRWTNSSWE